MIVIMLFSLPRYAGFVSFYNHFIFIPLQWLRGLLFGFLPFSLGDIIYVAGGIWGLVTLIRWIRYLVKFRQYKLHLAASMLRTLNALLFVYLFFVFGWGANYYQQPLRTYWHLDTGDSALARLPKDELRLRNTKELITFDSLLVERLNNFAPNYHSLSFKEINKRAEKYYELFTDTKLKTFGIGIKPTMFGYFMDRLAVEGYYNPFTGEGQIVKSLPAFTMPFLVSHEMAHQAGIAAEGDANLLAYAIGATAGDSTFNYSAYLSIWIYANNRLYRRDSVSSKRLETRLNKLTTAQLDTLEEISKKYQNKAANYSSELFDSYLKLHDQKEGIRSYGNATSNAMLWEQKNAIEGKKVISIP